MKKTALIIATALCVSTIFAGCGGATQAEPVTETPVAAATTQAPEEKAPETTNVLAEMFVRGINDRFVLQDSKNINYLRDTEYAEKIVEDVKVDDSEVDTTKAGTYTVHYTVKVNKTNLEKAQAYIDEHPEVFVLIKDETKKPAEKPETKPAEAGTQAGGENAGAPAETPAQDAEGVQENTDDAVKEDGNTEDAAQTPAEGTEAGAETPAAEQKEEETPAETPTETPEETKPAETPTEAPAEAPAETTTTDKTDDGNGAAETPAENPETKPAEEVKEPETVIPDIPESVFEKDKDDTTPDETEDIVIDKTVEVVTPEKAVEIIDQGGEVWTDSSEPVKKEDLVSPTEETVEKPEEKKEEEKTETTNTEPEQNDDSHQESHNDDSDDGDDYEEPSHSSGGSAQSEPKHEHHWVKKTRTVHHEDGHYETKQTGTETVTDNDAWDEPVYESVCRCTACGAEFSDEDDAAYHVVAEHNNEASWSVRDVQVDTIHHPAETHEEPVYEEQWVDDSWDEEVSDGYYCDGCGATK